MAISEPPPAGDNWSRAPDPTILKINCAVNVLVPAVREGIQEAMVDYTPEEYSLSASIRGATDATPCRYFVVKFLGPTDKAKEKVDRVMARLFNNGDWMRLSVNPPSSLPTPLYISRDKNRQQIQLEFQTKTLRNLIQASLPAGAKATMRRAKGLIFVDLQKIAQVDNIADESPPSVVWKPSLLTHHKLDKEQLLRSLGSQLAKPESAEEWCP